MEKISVGKNRTSGPIPETLGQLARLTSFTVTENELSGIVPSSIFNLSNLATLDIGTNQIQGSLPWDLGFTMPSLATLLSAITNSKDLFVLQYPMPQISCCTNLVETCLLLRSWISYSGLPLLATVLEVGELMT